MCECYDCHAHYGEFHRAKESWLNKAIDPDRDYWTWICINCLNKRNAHISGIDFIQIVRNPADPPLISPDPIILPKSSPKYILKKKRKKRI